MRNRRLTYINALHHVMNHSIDQRIIFRTSRDFAFFKSLIRKYSNMYDITIFSYCIMRNHYHIVLKNISGKMGDFIRVIESTYSQRYNKNNERKGSVFYDRYKSTLIEDDTYLKMAILYSLLNPKRAGIVENPFDYNHSSINELFADKTENVITDNSYVESIFRSKEEFIEELNEWIGKRHIEIAKYRYGEILGSNKYCIDIIKKTNRRQIYCTSNNMRKNDKNITWTLKEAYKYINEKYNIDIVETIFNTHHTKRARMELLIVLKEYCRMTYKEIIKLDPFKMLKYKTLSKMYTVANKLYKTKNL